MNHLYIGIDLGTSSVKLSLVSCRGLIIKQTAQDYDVLHPYPNYSEQDPNVWWKATKAALKALLEYVDTSFVKGISFGGQMHGLVILDDGDQVIRPCILWNDGRAEEEKRYLNEIIGKAKLSAMTGNIAFAGFTAPKLLWLKKHEPHHFERIDKIMLPKDYLSYLFSGEFCSDVSDASGTLFFNVRERTWSNEMCNICGILLKQLPKVLESTEVVGNIKESLAKEFGLSKDVKIIIGGGDNAVAAIGTGTIEPGSCNISLGTSGTILIPSEEYIEDKKNALHSFAHANGRYHLLGCILSAASARKWWLETILKSNDYAKDENDIIKANTEGLFFLPYLNGERSPHNDVDVRGAFIGLSNQTTQRDMSKAILEGVAFALRDCLEIAKGNGVKIYYSTLCGGGAKSGIWRQIIADVLNIQIRMLSTEQGPSFGAAILAMVGCHEYETLEEAVKRIIQVESFLNPIEKNVQEYNKKYAIFKRIYPALKSID